MDFGVTTEMTPDAAWEELKKADGKKDLDEFRKVRWTAIQQTSFAAANKNAGLHGIR